MSAVVRCWEPEDSRTTRQILEEKIFQSAGQDHLVHNRTIELTPAILECFQPKDEKFAYS